MRISRLHIILGSILLIAGLIYLGSCLYTNHVEPDDSVQIAIDWNRLVLDAEINTEGYRGPVAARTYAYIGLAAYEAANTGMRDYRSLQGLYPGMILPEIPHGDHYNLETALNACYHALLQNFFMSSTETMKRKMRDLYFMWEQAITDKIDSTAFKLSVQYGESVARAIYDWASTDTLGHAANLHNYDRHYKPPVGDGKWVPSAYFPMPPLLPYWGNVRTFIINPGKYLARELPEFSNDMYQFYYTQALEVLTVSKPLSTENKWIADFWNDDRPGLTFTPAGHWLAITNQVIERERPDIEKALETYLRVGFALSDATVACWKSKYIYNLERPETFIARNIDKDWRPYSPTPSFPSYPSGHSIMGAAAAQVLTALYGKQYKLTDYSHKDLPEFETRPRSFTSFEAMADENALSRIFIGVHYRIDCEEGLRLGDLIGEEVMKLELEDKLTQ